MADPAIRLDALFRRTLVAAFAVCALTRFEAARADDYPLMGQHVPAFSAPLAGGGMLTDQTLTGKWSVVEFWGLWCEDSMADLPYAEALARAIAQDPSLRFFSVHVDQRYGRWNTIEEFIAAEGTTYPIALDPRGEVERLFRVHATPSYLVIDSVGVIRAVRYDLRKDADPEGGVKGLIKDVAALKSADAARARAAAP